MPPPGALPSVEYDVLIYVDVISNKKSIFSSQIRTPSFPINWPSLLLDLQLYFEDFDLINLRTNTIQINISPKYYFVICDHKSDETPDL